MQQPLSFNPGPLQTSHSSNNPIQSSMQSQILSVSISTHSPFSIHCPHSSILNIPLQVPLQSISVIQLPAQSKFKSG